MDGPSAVTPSLWSTEDPLILDLVLSSGGTALTKNGMLPDPRVRTLEWGKKFPHPVAPCLHTGGAHRAGLLPEGPPPAPTVGY